MKVATAIERLNTAKRTIRHCKENGIKEPPEQQNLFDRSQKERLAIKQIAKDNKYAEPWASYIASYQYDLQQALT